MPGFALSGVTHTLCSPRAVETLRSLVTAPFETYDRLICTSRAVVAMVQSVTGAYADYLQERHGGSPRLRTGLELIPLGVDINKFRPAAPEERQAERRRLDIATDETMVLFVGRLSHHAKAHPFPMYRALAEAAERTSNKVHLVLSGWSSSPAVSKAFQDGAQQFAGRVRVSTVDGTRPENRFAVWQAADLFTSLSDNIQETFGLVIVEAMACGLPVVASDWNGYRDLVVNNETGFLVPTRMVRNATEDLALQAMVGELDYDHFLARSNQCVAIDVAAATEAYATLLRDEDIRRRMGTAGRQRAEALFAWSHVIRAYEDLWQSQRAELAASVTGDRGHAKPFPGPAAYPALEHSFASYPTTWLELDQHVVAGPTAIDRLPVLLTTALVNYESDSRCSNLTLLQSVLELGSRVCSLGDLAALFQDAGVESQAALVTLAWMLKYDLLRPVN
ncbi:MAG: glycosyltransferase family 4 protein, partial [Pirellulaceae bacterium]